MKINLAIDIVPFIALIISLISIFISICNYNFIKKSRKNDKRPHFVIEDSISGYHQLERRIPKVDIIIKNIGERASWLKVEELTGNCDLGYDKNATINKNETIKIHVNSKHRIDPRDFEYQIKIITTNIDGEKYSQIFDGKSVTVTPKSIK